MQQSKFKDYTYLFQWKNTVVLKLNQKCNYCTYSVATYLSPSSEVGWGLSRLMSLYKDTVSVLLLHTGYDHLSI